MIQSNNFILSKRIAQLPMGIGGNKNSFIYWADFRRQWESSYSNAKMIELIGSQSVPEFCLPDVWRWIGSLSEQEKEFAEQFRNFYNDVVKLVTTLDTQVSCETDLAETLLDMRILKKHVKFPVRVLDIGPGAGRNLLGMFLYPECRGGVYVGIESIGLPYIFQNIIASTLWSKAYVTKFYDYLDYKFGRKDFPDISSFAENSVAHLPLWDDALLPDEFFDVIICNYVLDEVPALDFHKIAGIAGRCLSKEGVVYCRGSQQRAMLKDLYLYGYGTYHGQDITKMLLSKGLKAKSCEIISSQMVRLFVHQNSNKSSEHDSKYSHFSEDLPLVQEIQKDYIETQLRELEMSKQKVLIWGDSGYEHYLKYIAPYRDKLNIIGATHRFVQSKAMSGLGIMEYPSDYFTSLSPDVVIIASMRDKSIVKHIRKMSSPDEFKLVRKFNYPIALAYRQY